MRFTVAVQRPRASRRSAQEAAKRFRPNPVSDDDEDDRSLSARRARKIINSPQEVDD